MSWLLFLDESGHDHKQMPYEVRGGIAVHAGQLWPLVQAIQRLELDCFGVELHQYKKELKGSTLLDKKRYRFAEQSPVMRSEERRKHARAFLTKGLKKESPHRDEFTAYGQACIEMARGIFELLRSHQAVVFASAIPCNPQLPQTEPIKNLLRKDHVFLLERYYYFLNQREEHGLIVFDEHEKSADRRFIRRVEDYFIRTRIGRQRSRWIVPVPMSVASDMSYLIQLADVIIYCINWGFRLPNQGMDMATRQEIEVDFKEWLYQLQFQGSGEREGNSYRSYGIVYVHDPYSARE